MEHPFFSLIIVDDHFHALDKHLCFMRNEKIPVEFIKKTWSKISMKDQKGNLFLRKLMKESYKLLDWPKIHSETLALCRNHPSVKLITGQVRSIIEEDKRVKINLGENKFISCDKLFNSVQLVKNNANLVQQFQGAIVEFDHDVYDADDARLMDFDGLSTQGSLEFKYELAFTSRKALVEYTVITSKVLPKEEIQARFSQMLQGLKGVERITNEESGIIPMPTTKHININTARILYIGLAGGFQRRSSGYLLQSVHDQLESWVDFISSTGTQRPRANKLTEFLDTIFLNVLRNNFSLGQRLFISMFNASSGDQFLRFMFNPMSIKNIYPVVMSLPKRPFLKYAAIHLKSFF